ncbi:MAG: cysteine desulfurase family protein [Planctomycetota bacterium]
MRYDLDHNSTTPVDPRVLEAFLEIERSGPANPASLHGSGRRARGIVEDSRKRIAELLGRRPDEVVFTSGGTESNNLAVRGVGDPSLPVLLGEVEHPSVLQPARGRGLRLWRTDPSGRVRIEPPAGAVGLLCLVHAQSETGAVQPIGQASALARSLGVPLHVDAAQSLGRLPLADVLAAADTVALSPHKAAGLRGIGILLFRRGVAVPRPLMLGGGQEMGIRPGTQSPALCFSAARCVELAVAETERRARLASEAKSAFLDALSATGVDSSVVSPTDGVLPNTIMIRFGGIDGRSLLPALDLAGVEASHGSACSSGAPEPPLVLRAMGFSEEDARCCVRFSFGWTGSREDARRAGRLVGEVVGRLKKN